MSGSCMGEHRRCAELRRSSVGVTPLPEVRVKEQNCATTGRAAAHIIEYCLA